MIVCTSGDPFSVNIELYFKIFSQTLSAGLPCPVVYIGNEWQWNHQLSRLGLRPDSIPMARIESLHEAQNNEFYLMAQDGPEIPAEHLTSVERGTLAVGSLREVRNCLPSRPLAVLTAPIDKKACNEAGFGFPGQTEYFEEIWNTRGIMVLAGPKLKVGLVTNHLPVHKISEAINRDLMIEKALSFAQTLKQTFKIDRPHIAICGLNPHCGEGGTCGREEINIMAPAFEKLIQMQPEAEFSGPLPADTVFWQSIQGQFDGVLAMYHDQGLGPLKTVHFFDAINLTGGLPHLRVSPDHGPAANLFLKGHAREDSIKLAWDTCLQYMSHKA